MRIKHPTIPGMAADVDNPAEWLAAGWLSDEPKPEPAKDEPKPAKGAK